ncbi:MAG: AraC family transcriptional regulator [Gammaproteobacteria bacterium]|nr:AraC family transcriptional regulator [Gammaproteobacteria bacterium]
MAGIKTQTMESKNIHLVKAAFHTQFKTAMESCGVSADHYFNKVNLPTVVSDPESLLPVNPFYHLVNKVAIDENIPDFGSQVARLTPWHKVLSLGPLIRDSSDLKNLLDTFCEIGSSQSSPVSFKLIDESSHFSFCYTNTLMYKGDVQMELYRITSMIQLVQLSTGTRWRPETIRLNMPENRAVDACPLLTNSEIRFLQPISAISIRPDLLQLPVHLNTPDKPNIDDRDADFNTNFINSIRQIIGSYSQSKNINIEEVASIANMSVRSLQRRLKAEGLRYNDLLSQARYGHAKEKLKNSELPVSEIAKSLGYTDPAHFTRAFRRWSGLSPSAFRKIRDS